MLSNASFDVLQQHQPETVDKLQTALSLAREATDAELLGLCSQYIDSALARQTWSPPQGGVSDREQAFIDFTEQFTSSVAHTTDAQVGRLLEHATPDEVYAFVNALYLEDMTRRLARVTGSVLS